MVTNGFPDISILKLTYQSQLSLFDMKKYSTTFITVANCIVPMEYYCSHWYRNVFQHPLFIICCKMFFAKYRFVAESLSTLRRISLWSPIQKLYNIFNCVSVGVEAKATLGARSNSSWANTSSDLLSPTGAGFRLPHVTSAEIMPHSPYVRLIRSVCVSSTCEVNCNAYKTRVYLSTPIKAFISS